MHTRRAGILVLAVFAGINGCGSDDARNDNAGGENPPPVAQHIEIRGALPYLATDGELAVFIGTDEFAGEILADGSYRAAVPIEKLTGDALVRIEARDEAQALVMPLAAAGRIADLAGSDHRLERNELAQVDFREFHAASYAVLVAANGGEHVDSESSLVDLQRDRLDGDLALRLAAALRLNLRDGHALPEGVADSWQMTLDHAASAAFLDAVRATDAVSGKVAALAVETPDRVDAVIDEIVEEIGATVPYQRINGALPSLFFHVTTISRELEMQTGFNLMLRSDGTGYTTNEGGQDTLTWDIDDAGRIVVEPDNGMPVVLRGGAYVDDVWVPSDVSTLTERMVLTRLQETPLNDLLHVEISRRGQYLNPDLDHLNDEMPLVTFERSMIALNSSGRLAWAEDEPIGVWALPGVLASEDQVNVADVPVKTDDIYEFHVDEDGVGRGRTLLAGETFTWQFRDEFETNRRVGVDITWDANGSGVVFYKVRAEGAAFDMFNAAAVLQGDELKKYASGSLGFKREDSAAFTEANAIGSYLLYGATNPLSPVTSRFTMFVQPDHHVTFEDLDDEGNERPFIERRWQVDEQGRLIVSAHRRISFVDGVPLPGENDADCLDPETCYIWHERIEHPFVRDGNRLYVLEEQVYYNYDQSKPFGKGSVHARQRTLRYWDISALPE